MSIKSIVVSFVERVEACLWIDNMLEVQMVTFCPTCLIMPFILNTLRTLLLELSVCVGVGAGLRGDGRRQRQV